MNITKLVRMSKKGQFVIPKEMREALGMKEGEELLVTLEAGKVVLTRPHEYARMTRGLLKGTWGKGRKSVERYIKKERRSWESVYSQYPRAKFHGNERGVNHANT